MSGDFNQRWDEELDRREERRFLREMVTPLYYRPVYDPEGTTDTSRKPPTSDGAAAPERQQNINSEKGAA